MSKKILIVDDDALVLKTLMKLLERAGYEVYTAKSAEEARNSIELNSYDLIISDIRLPGENGLSLIESIKEAIHKQTRKFPPVIFITGYANDEAPSLASKLGAHDYILKPFDMELLLSSVHKACDQNKREL